MYLDTDKLAQELYDRSLGAEEVPLSDLRKLLSLATPGHEAIDEPEQYRWFLIRRFPVKSFGITLKEMMKEGTSHDRWQHDYIVDRLGKGEPAYPAFATATGVVIDGYHRIAAHGTLKDKAMDVVVAVKRRPADYETEWNSMWNEAFP
jgi:hypothetical protein